MPVYVATFDGIVSGRVHMTLDTGELCEGAWSRVPGPPSMRASTASVNSATQDLSEEWDRIYGAGYFARHVVDAATYARAVVSGNRGTILTVEFYKPPDLSRRSGPSSIIGVARDNQGNVFRLTY